MSEIMAIASGTWKNILRMKVVYFLILCVWILIGSAALYEVLSMGQHKPLMIDVSLALNAVAAALVVISITFEIPRELRQGVASTLLTKSLGRTQYLAGKLIGIAFAAIVICALITFGSFVIFSYTFSESIALPMFQAQLLQILSIIPMAAIGVFFATLFPEVVAPGSYDHRNLVLLLCRSSPESPAALRRHPSESGPFQFQSAGGLSCRYSVVLCRACHAVGNCIRNFRADAHKSFLQSQRH